MKWDKLGEKLSAVYFKYTHSDNINLLIMTINNCLVAYLSWGYPIISQYIYFVMIFFH